MGKGPVSWAERANRARLSGSLTGPVSDGPNAVGPHAAPSGVIADVCPPGRITRDRHDAGTVLAGPAVSSPSSTAGGPRSWNVAAEVPASGGRSSRLAPRPTSSAGSRRPHGSHRRCPGFHVSEAEAGADLSFRFSWSPRTWRSARGKWARPRRRPDQTLPPDARQTKRALIARSITAAPPALVASRRITSATTGTVSD